MYGYGMVRLKCDTMHLQCVCVCMRRDICMVWYGMVWYAGAPAFLGRERAAKT